MTKSRDEQCSVTTSVQRLFRPRSFGAVGPVLLALILAVLAFSSQGTVSLFEGLPESPPSQGAAHFGVPSAALVPGTPAPIGFFGGSSGRPRDVSRPTTGGSGSVVANINVGANPDGAAYDAGNGETYIENWGSNNVSVVTGTNLVGTIPVGSGPTRAAYDNATGYVYVPNGGGSTLSVISGNKVIGNVTVGSAPWNAVYDSRNGYVYVPNNHGSSVTVVSGMSVVATIPVGSEPSGVAYDSTNGDIYVTNWASNNVSVISGTMVVATISIGTNPGGVSYDVGNGYIYVANWGSTTVNVLSGTTVVGVISVGSQPGYISYDDGNGYVYVPNKVSNNVSVISGMSVVATIPVGPNPNAAVYASGNGFVYVENYNSNNVSVISTSVNSSGSLTSVAISPSSPTLTLGATVTLTATSTCSGGACPAGTKITWSLNNSLGRLNATSGSVVTFVAGTAPGMVRLTATGSLNNKSAQGTDTVTILPSLVAVAVTPSNVVVSAQGTVAFQASVNCTGGATCPRGVLYSWGSNLSLGTLNATTGSEVCYTAGSIPGNGTLTVRATLNGSSFIASSSIRVLGQFLVTLGVSTSSGSAPLTVNFTAGATGGEAPYAFGWMFGDGSSGTGANPSHTFTQAGNYLVTMTGNDGHGEVAYANTTIVVFSEPTGNGTSYLELSIEARPATGAAPLYVHLVGSAQGGKSPYNFFWSFGDGTNFSVSGPASSSVHHNYTAAGTYVASLTVTDSAGNEGTTGVFITAYSSGGKAPAGPSAFVDVLAMQGSAPFAATLVPVVQGGNAPYTLNWSFGDGATLDQQQVVSVTHTYSGPGTYYPRLRVTDSSRRDANWSSGVSGFSHPIVVSGSLPKQLTPLYETVWFELTMGAVVLAVVVGTAFILPRQRRRKGREIVAKGEGVPGSSMVHSAGGAKPAPPIPPSPPSKVPEGDQFIDMLASYWARPCGQEVSS